MSVLTTGFDTREQRMEKSFVVAASANVTCTEAAYAPPAKETRHEPDVALVFAGLISSVEAVDGAGDRVMVMATSTPALMLVGNTVEPVSTTLMPPATTIGVVDRAVAYMSTGAAVTTLTRKYGIVAVPGSRVQRRISARRGTPDGKLDADGELTPREMGRSTELANMVSRPDGSMAVPMSYRRSAHRPALLALSISTRNIVSCGIAG
jgi:hypothetical protein